MDDAAGVQRRQRGQHVERDRQGLAHAQWAASQPLVERFATQQLHGDEQLALVLDDLVDLTDIRVVDARRGARLAQEALACRGVTPRFVIVLSATERLKISLRAS